MASVIRTFLISDWCFESTIADSDRYLADPDKDHRHSAPDRTDTAAAGKLRIRFDQSAHCSVRGRLPVGDSARVYHRSLSARLCPLLYWDISSSIGVPAGFDYREVHERALLAIVCLAGKEDARCVYASVVGFNQGEYPRSQRVHVFAVGDRLSVPHYNLSLSRARVQLLMSKLQAPGHAPEQRTVDQLSDDAANPQRGQLTDQATVQAGAARRPPVVVSCSHCG